MYKRIALCDIHGADGEEVVAIAEYEGDGGEMYHTCEEHLATVKSAKMPYTMLGNNEDPDE